MKKFKVFFDIIKEEQWLNEQLQDGYQCTKINGLGMYTFKKTNKQYIIRLDYQGQLSKEKLEEYQDIYLDFGWSCIKSSRFSGIQYWQKENNDQTEIFSDRQSKGNYYKRLMNYSSSLGILSLFFSFLLYKDTGLYLTEGLWDMEGSLFWIALIFETPFVILRSSPLIIAIIFGLSFYKAYQKYSVLKDK